MRYHRHHWWRCAMNAAELRALIKRCAAKAVDYNPVDLDGRARSFAANLTGALEHHGDLDLAKVVWAMTSSSAFESPQSVKPFDSHMVVPPGPNSSLQTLSASALIADEIDRTVVGVASTEKHLLGADAFRSWATKKLFKMDATSGAPACPCPAPSPSASSPISVQGQEPTQTPVTP